MDRPLLFFQRATIVLAVALALVVGCAIGFFTGFRFGQAPAAEASNASTAANGAAPTAHEGRPKTIPSPKVTPERRPFVVKNTNAANFEDRLAGIAAAQPAAPAKSAEEKPRDEAAGPIVENTEIVQPVIVVAPGPAAAPEPSASAVLSARKVGAISIRAEELLADPHGNRLFAATKTSVKQIDTAARTIIRDFTEINGRPHSLCLDARSENLFLLQEVPPPAGPLTNFQEVVTFDLGKMVATAHYPLDSPANTLIADGAGGLFVSLYGKSTAVRLLDARNGHEITHLTPITPGPIGTIAYSQSTASLLRGNVTGTPLDLSRLKVENGRLTSDQIVTVPGTHGLALCLNHYGDAVCFLTDSATKDAAASGHPLALRSTVNLQQTLGTFSATFLPTLGVFSPDDQSFFIAADKQIEGFSTVTFERTHAFTTDFPIRALTFERTGKFLFVATDHEISVFEVPAASKAVAKAVPR